MNPAYAAYTFAMMSGMLDLSRDENAKHFLPRWLSSASAVGRGCVISAPRSRFESPSMQCRKRNHALRKVQPCTCASPSMQVAEWNHASSRVQGSASAFPSIETFLNFLTWIWRQLRSRRQCLGGVRNALGGCRLSMCNSLFWRGKIGSAPCPNRVAPMA